MHIDIIWGAIFKTLKGYFQLIKWGQIAYNPWGPAFRTLTDPENEVTTALIQRWGPFTVFFCTVVPSHPLQGNCSTVPFKWGWLKIHSFSERYAITSWDGNTPLIEVLKWSLTWFKKKKKVSLKNPQNPCSLANIQFLVTYANCLALGVHFLQQSARLKKPRRIFFSAQISCSIPVSFRVIFILMRIFKVNLDAADFSNPCRRKQTMLLSILCAESVPDRWGMD